MLSSLVDSMQAIFGSIGLADVLDILIVAGIIYAILINIRSKSAQRIAFAIVALILLTGVTDVAKMKTLNFLLSKILEIGVVALVIVFQPELRLILEKIGAKSLHLLNSRNMEMTIDQQMIAKVAAACEVMSKERTGVLLVFERDYALDDYFKSGTMIDAEISTELLRNLFFTKASLHDGAVIIKHGRIAAAGCVLPLTKNTNISSDLGTRHRAALGMSEESDAVVVVVSEETGTISVAINGELKRPLTTEMLRKVLLKELHVDEPERPLPKWVLKIRDLLAISKKENDENE